LFIDRRGFAISALFPAIPAYPASSAMARWILTTAS